MDNQDQQGLLDLLEIQDSQGQQDLRGILVLQDNRVREAASVQSVLLALRGLQEILESRAFQVQLVNQGRWGRAVI